MDRLIGSPVIFFIFVFACYCIRSLLVQPFFVHYYSTVLYTCNLAVICCHVDLQLRVCYYELFARRHPMGVRTVLCCTVLYCTVLYGASFFFFSLVLIGPVISTTVLLLQVSKAVALRTSRKETIVRTRDREVETEHEHTLLFDTPKNGHTDQ
jgi:hypothetical protein